MKIFKKIIPVPIVVVFLLSGIGVYLNFKSINKLNANSKIDYIKVEKSERRLTVYSGGRVIKIYKIALGKSPNEAKQYRGDNRTPEGVYFINGKNANSIAHKNLGISYPNNKDISRAKKLGKPAGGDIKIHGMMNGLGFIGCLHTFFDWTNGCIAVTDGEMDALYSSIKIGTQIEIVP